VRIFFTCEITPLWVVRDSKFGKTVADMASIELDGSNVVEISAVARSEAE
jgi:hypothetical protein